MPVTREAVLETLEEVTGGRAGVSGVVIRGERVGFSLEVENASAEAETLRQRCEAAVRALPGVEKVTAVLTAHGTGSGKFSSDMRASSATHLPPEQRRPAEWNREPLEGVRHVVAVASGKGGVGKSTTTVNLALALTALGWKVGILDADVYGPSIPRMMNAPGRAEVQDGRLVPREGYGVRCLSVGHLTDGDGPLAWRGSMATKAIRQMTRLVHWAPKGETLDALLVDMPPGTGDVHLTLAQSLPLSGAVIVTTPQEVALMDARKSLEMFRKMDVPVLGVVENMSGPVFGSGGGKAMAAQYAVPFLGEVALEAGIREGGDAGQPVALGRGPLAEVYRTIAEQVKEAL